MRQLVPEQCSITDTFNKLYMDQEKHIQKELEDLMKYEWMRLASFASFPLSSPAHSTRLAEAGFYFQGNDDEVTCFRCGVKYKGWKAGDVPINVHKNISPQCPFLAESKTEKFGIQKSPWKFTNGNDNKLSVHDNINIGSLDKNKTVTNTSTLNGTPGACGGPSDLKSTDRSSTLNVSSTKQNNDTSQHATEVRKPATDNFHNNSNETHQTNTIGNGHIGSKSGQRGCENLPSNRPFDFSFTASGSKNDETAGINDGTSRNSERVPNGRDIPNGNLMDVPNGSKRTNGHTSNVTNGGNSGNENSVAITNGANGIQSSSSFIEPSELEAFGFVLEPLGISCAKPVYPQYAISTIRMSSYKEWPKCYKQHPEELTKAGLFFEGTNDRVRCFFCGGGLFNWEEDDDPWIEHARWFPKCVYLRQSKGDEFIYKVHQEVRKGTNDFSHLKDYNPNQHLQTAAASASSVKNDVMSHPAVVSVLDMGVNSTLVKKAMEAICKLNGNKELTAEKLLLKVWEIEDSGGTETASNDNEQLTNEQSDKHVSRGTDIPGSADINTDEDEAERLAIMEENRHLRELQLCKICLDEDVSIVFLPCGHMATCATCAPALRKCPICRVFIKGTVKAIIS